MEKKKEKPNYRIVKVGKKYMPQKLGMWITPDSYGNLVPAYANMINVPCDYETAEACVKLYTEEKEIVWEGN